MYNLATDSDLRRKQRVTLSDAVPAVTETVRVRPAPPEAGQTHVGVDPARWGLDALRSYIATQIERHHGPFPRDAKKERAILSSFLARWGAQAGPIAEYAFTVAGGMWRGAPVGMTRFCKGSDPYFAALIAEKLARRDSISL